MQTALEEISAIGSRTKEKKKLCRAFEKSGKTSVVDYKETVNRILITIN